MDSSFSPGIKHPSGVNTETCAVKEQEICEDQAGTQPCRFAGCSGTYHLSPAETFHLFFSTGTGMKQVEILGEVPSVEAVRGHPSSYFEERMPERDMIAGFFLFFSLVIISVFFPILPCLPQICTVRGEEESQWESVPGIGAFLQQGHRFQMLFYRDGHETPVSFVHSLIFFFFFLHQ